VSEPLEVRASRWRVGAGGQSQLVFELFDVLDAGRELRSGKRTMVGENERCSAEVDVSDGELLLKLSRLNLLDRASRTLLGAGQTPVAGSLLGCVTGLAARLAERETIGVFAALVPRVALELVDRVTLKAKVCHQDQSSLVVRPVAARRPRRCCEQNGSDR
jgi:hypothetical protein